MVVEQNRIFEIPTLPRPAAEPVSMPEWARHLPKPPVEREPMAVRGPLALRRTRALRAKLGNPAAVLAATFVVALSCLYLNQYARVTAEGFELSRLKNQVAEAERENEQLQAEVGRLTLPDAVGQRAVAAGMVENTPQSAVVASGPAGAGASLQQQAAAK